MKRLLASLFRLFLLLAPLRAAFAGDTPALESYRVQILFNRVHHVLVYRSAALHQCAEKLAPRGLLVLNDLLDEALERPASASSLHELLGLYQESRYWERPGLCDKELAKHDQALAKQERAKFHGKATVAKDAACVLGLGLAGGAACAFETDQLIEELDPHCAVEVSPDFDGGRETNPCFAGDTLVTDELWRSAVGRDTVFAELDSFLWRFHDAVEAAVPGAALDYRDFYRLGDRKLFLAILAFFSASSTSSSGYVDGFGEFAWREGLLRGDSASAVLTRYHDLKRRKDLFRDLLAWASKKKLRLVLGAGIDLTRANRHDFMAAYIACHFRDQGQAFLSKALPRLLGYAYESLDFVSHIKGGVSLSKSIDNFDEDTDRYVRASKWGSAFCSRGE